MSALVAALYVDRLGPYPKLLGREYCWDAERDARLYAGPWPVVAHPPCGAWANLRHLSRGDGKDCGPRAVEQVRAFGGILEQPAGSKLWEHCALPKPYAGHDGHGFSIEVEQVSWGHVARKRTWLYFAHISNVDLIRIGTRSGGTPTHWVSGGRNQMRKNGRAGGGVVPPGIKVCSAQQRRRTPVAFAEWLIALARTATPAREAAR